jgi:pyridoxine 5-phosphate synthase
MKTRLSVNVDHVATVRQARGAPYPDPVEAAGIAEAAGASGITAHLRVDRRHIQDSDVARLKEAVRGKLNLELATDREMVEVALRVRPDQVTLVPERPDEITTEGGLDLRRQASAVGVAALKLSHAGIGVSLFLDPDPLQIDLLGKLRDDLDGDAEIESPLEGFEINTDAYTKTSAPEEIRVELDKVRRAVDRGVELGFHVYAGHGLTVGNVGPIAALEAVEELNIGHALISRAVLVGLQTAVREMLEAMENG